MREVLGIILAGGVNPNSWHEPDISVIVPTRDRPLLLREALASISVQRGARFEVIVVNDGGCDVSDVLSEFSATPAAGERAVAIWLILTTMIFTFRIIWPGLRLASTVSRR
jgi:hypothetical protein